MINFAMFLLPYIRLLVRCGGVLHRIAVSVWMLMHACAIGIGSLYNIRKKGAHVSAI